MEFSCPGNDLKGKVRLTAIESTAFGPIARRYSVTALLPDRGQIDWID